MSAACNVAVEDQFGPFLATTSCLDGFDFTLLFEETILTILPLGIALLWALGRFSALWRLPNIIAARSTLLLGKLATYAVFLSMQLALLIQICLSDTVKTRTTIATAAFVLFGFACLTVVSYYEHCRAIRPSTVLDVYLGISLLFDLARVRTTYFLPNSSVTWALYLTTFFLKILLLFLEIIEKANLIIPSDLKEGATTAPEQTGGIFNRSLFLWVNATLLKGYRSALGVDTLSALDDQLLAASYTDPLLKRWEHANKSRKDALLWTVFWHYKWQFFAGVLPRLAYAGFTFAQPFLITRTLDYTSSTQESRNIGYGLLAAYALVYVGIGISRATYQHKTYRLLTLYRGSLIALVYEKTLRVSALSAMSTDATTRMSADNDRIGVSLAKIHDVYASAIELGVSLYIVYFYLGIAMVAPTIWVALTLFISTPVATAAGDAQVPWLEAIEERLDVTTRALHAMRSIKMTGLSKIVAPTVSGMRGREVKASLRFRMLDILVNVVAWGSTALTPVWGLGTYAILATARNTAPLTEGIAFGALSAFDLQDQPTLALLDGILDIRTTINCFRRIQEFLLSDECQDQRVVNQTSHGPSLIEPSLSSAPERDATQKTSLEKSNSVPSSSIDYTTYSVKAEDVCVAFDSSKTAVLKDLNFELNAHSITALIGPVGCGKTTLLKAILGEVPISTGSILSSWRHAAYCPQSAWVDHGTIRSNILGISSWDELWYNRVVDACALDVDLAEMPQGDLSGAGSRGSRLSGGQQARVSLARALYSRHKTMILDDVLSGLDRNTEDRILDAVFGPQGLIRHLGATVIAATSSLTLAKQADYIIHLSEDGTISQQGTSDTIDLPSPESLIIARPQTKSEKVEGGDEAGDEASDDDDANAPADDPNEYAIDDLSRKTGDLRIYGYYASVAGWATSCLYLLLCAGFMFTSGFPSIWVQWWSNDQADHPNQRTGYWVGIYGLLGGITLLTSVISECVHKLLIVPKTSIRFHEILLTTTMKSTSTFLTSTDVGVTINRFSQDLELIDNDLPLSLDAAILEFMAVVFSGALVLAGSSYISAVLPLAILCIYVIQVYYLRTSRQLRLLDIEAKAPLFSMFLDSMVNISGIRAYGWSDIYIERHRARLNRSQKPYYLMWCIQRWLGLVLDLFVAGFAVVLVAIATNVRSGSTGFLGAALFNVLSFTSTLQNLILEWTQVETAVGAINRIRTFAKETPREADEDENDNNLGREWPSEGAILIEDINASYEAEDERRDVLKNISLNIRPGEKVALCGRTGSGKSSLLSTMTRMLDLDSGRILIDNIDITSVPRQRVREQLNTIPQEPFFLPGTIRHNLDPLHITPLYPSDSSETSSSPSPPLEKQEDVAVIELLTTLRLWDTIESHGGLDEDFNPQNFSHGQRQLLCLARAVLRPGKVVLMDEVTSSVDAETDELMQRVLREKFAGRTIIATAHRLETILDFDRVVLLDQGRIVAEGSPRELAQSEESRGLNEE